jgi:DNA-binding transcriptional regulator GbsR (MarR family)
LIARAPARTLQGRREGLPLAKPMSHDPPTLEPMGPQLHAVVDGVGDLMAFWGFPRSHGRIWALLYLAERPLHAGEIGTVLELSGGQVSVSLRDLEQWQVVHGERPRGERRTWYRPETNVFRMVTRVYRERELLQVRQLARTLLAAKEELAATGGEVAAARLRKLRGLLALTELGREVVERLGGGRLLPKWVQTALDRPLEQD